MPDVETLIAEFEKNAREVCRVRLTTFKGVDLVDIRTFYQDADGEWKPGKGIALKRTLISELIEALQKAQESGE